MRLAVDFAASMDCQRYNQFDGLFLQAPDFFPILGESLAWGELFTLPQVPTSVLPTLRRAFARINWSEATAGVAAKIDRFFDELERLSVGLCVDRPTAMPRSTARSDYPLLWEHARAPAAGVNPRYLDPFGSDPRDQDRYVFFDGGDQDILVLPSPFAAAAGCEAAFRVVWSDAGSTAGEIVGDTMEKCVAIACGRHGARVWEKESYRAGGKQLEIDVAVRDGRGIVLFETKAKSLRSVSRTGDLMAFIDDLTKSFVVLLRQLVRHESHLRSGLTALAGSEDDLDGLRVSKVAVSPLSYGPASDHVLSSSLFRAVVGARFHAADGNPEHDEILEGFIKAIEQTVGDMVQIAENQQADLFQYMIDVHWLDLGQLIYVLQRGRSVPHSLAALRHLTFSTRDFWTEAAWADRQSLTESHWYPAGEQ